MFLPGCYGCGQCGCVCGALPYTMTVEFSGLQNKTHSQHCALTFASSFGSGAAAVAMSPGGCDDSEPECGSSDRGALSVLLTNGGSCYARIGRREPVLTITASPGEDATFTATLSAIDSKLPAQCRSYKLASVSVSGGTGYADGTTLTIKSDGTIVTPAVAKLTTVRSEPTLTASVSGGTGTVLAVTLASNGDDPETWGVASVSVTSPGTGYTDGDAVTFTVGDRDHIVVAATATISAGTSPPACTDTSCGELYYSADGGGSGSGAAASWSWTAVGDLWALTGFTLTNAGSGYAVGDHLVWTMAADPENGIYEIVITSVGGSGEITGWAESSDLYTAADFVGEAGGTGGISSVTVTQAGKYWHDSGVPASVTVTTPGEYFTEDKTVPACVADVTVTPCGGGSGATITPTIDTEYSSPTFGQITGLSVSGGTGYLAWHWVCTSLAGLNGDPVVLTATDPQKLCTLKVTSCFGSGACIRIVPTGETITCESEPTTRTAAYDGGPTPIRAIAIEPNGYKFGAIYDPTTGLGYAKIGRETPTWTVTQAGWTFTPAWGEADEDECGLPWWPIASFAISGTGTPMANGTKLSIATSGYEKTGVAAKATIVVNEDGTPTSVTVQRPGRYFRENPALPPYVADITVSVVQLSPSAGSGCEIAVEVEDDPFATGFGGIKSATIVSEGGGYTLLGAPADCTYVSTPCDRGLDGQVDVTFALRGINRAPRITLLDTRGGVLAPFIVLEADDVFTGDCASLPSSATLLYGAPSGVAATITRGGTVETPCDNPAWCGGCQCPDFDDYCSSITWADIPPEPPGGGGNRSGSLQGVGNLFEQDGIFFAITCDPATKTVSLGASAGRVCEGGDTTLAFTKLIQDVDDCCNITGVLVGEHTLTPSVACDTCPCGSITWTISEAPC